MSQREDDKHFPRFNALLLLTERQKALMQEYQQWEQIQTDFSYDSDLYRFCQWKMDSLDTEAEEIRRILESGGCL